MKTRVWKAAGLITFLGVAFTAFMGFAHTKAGRPALVWLGKISGQRQACPLGYDKHATLEEREEFRKRAALDHRGRRAAASRAAFSFQLGDTTRKELTSWTEQAGGECKRLQTPFELECAGPMFGAGSTTLWLEFNSKDQLVSLRGVEKFKTSAAAVDLYNQARKNLRAQRAPDLVERGDPQKDVIAGGLLAQSSIAAEFSNFSAVIRLTKMPDGLAITQNYVSF